MQVTKCLIAGALLGLPLVAACRGSSSNPDAPVVTDTSGGQMHIQDVQSDAMAVNTMVELRGVVITAIDAYGARVGDMWVEEPGGGPFSGVHVFRPPNISQLAVGDVIDISGAIKTEFKLNGAKGSVTEIQAPSGGTMTITKTGTGAVPAPAVVDFLAIGTKATEAERLAEWEKWEGVLITGSNVLAFDSPDCILSRGACNDPTRTTLSITGVAKLESNLAAFPDSGIQRGDCLKTLTGIVDYAFDFVVFPRATADVVSGGTSCVLEISTAATNMCTDGLDNDGNGFNDCTDFGCRVGPGAWLGETCAPADAMCGCSTNLVAGTSVNKVNTGTVGTVLLHEVFVTAVGAKGFWIADALQAAPSGGAFVSTNAALDAAIIVGAKLETVQGIAGTSGTGTVKRNEIASATPGAASAGGDLLPITNATPAQVASLTDGVTFAGSLVQLSNLKVTAVDATTKRVTLKDNTSTTIIMDSGAFPDFGGTPPTVDTCFATLVGVMDLLTTEQIRTINPRSAADMVATGGTCN